MRYLIGWYMLFLPNFVMLQLYGSELISFTLSLLGLGASARAQFMFNSITMVALMLQGLLPLLLFCGRHWQRRAEGKQRLPR